MNFFKNISKIHNENETIIVNFIGDNKKKMQMIFVRASLISNLKKWNLLKYQKIKYERIKYYSKYTK
jgi:hypothetical protein